MGSSNGTVPMLAKNLKLVLQIHPHFNLMMCLWFIIGHIQEYQQGYVMGRNSTPGGCGKSIKTSTSGILDIVIFHSAQIS